MSEVINDSSRKRRYLIRVYFSEEEYKTVLENIKKCNIRNKTNYGRKMMCDGYIIAVNSEMVLKKFLAELGRCSGSLNSIAKRANITQSIYADDLSDVYQELEKIKKTVGEAFRNFRHAIDKNVL